MISFTIKKKKHPQGHPTSSHPPRDPGHLQAPPSGIDWEAMSDQWMLIATEPVPMWPAFPPATVPWTAEGRGGLAPRNGIHWESEKKIHVSFVLANPRLMVHCTDMITIHGIYWLMASNKIYFQPYLRFNGMATDHINLWFSMLSSL
jgi:hypothetical protein